jgi:CRP-like cAMP-binding protein
VIGETLVAHLSSIGNLAREDRDAVLRLEGEVRTLKRHEDIVKAGDSPKAAVVVLGGFLQRYVSRRDGSRQIHAFYVPTDAPSLESLHLDVMDNNLCAVVQSTVGLVAHSDLRRLMHDRPNVQALMWRSSLIQAAMFREWLMRNSRLAADAAMAHLFCEIYTRSRAAGLVEGGSCDMPVTQEMLADALGLTGVHVNRTLQTLRDTGMVEHKSGRLLVYDYERLASFGDFDPAYLHLRNGRPT